MGCAFLFVFCLGGGGLKTGTAVAKVVTTDNSKDVRFLCTRDSVDESERGERKILRNWRSSVSSRHHYENPGWHCQGQQRSPFMHR